MPLVPRLRPAALVVAAGDIRRLVRKRDQLAGAKPIDVAALAADVRDERAVALSDEAHEWCEVELLRDAGLVIDRPRQWQRQGEGAVLRTEGRELAQLLPRDRSGHLSPSPLGNDSYTWARRPARERQSGPDRLIHQTSFRERNR